MKNHIKLLKSTSIIAVMAFMACNSANTQSDAEVGADTSKLEFTVEEAPEWTALFVRQSGWFGADGIYAVPQDGARYKSPSAGTTNMFIFSDSMVGEIEDGKIKSQKMVNNTVAYMEGSEPKEENIKFYWNKGEDGKPQGFFIPNTPSAKPGDYYWLGDTFYNTETEKTYIIAYRMHTMDPNDDWTFREMGTNLIIIPKGSKPPFKDQQQVETPLHFEGTSNGGFGAGIFVNTKEAGAPNPDGYVYVYGNGGPKSKGLIVARVMQKDFEDFSAWRFYNGKEWVADIQQTAPLVTGVSNELSFSPTPDGRYVLVFQSGGMSTTVGLRVAASPVGPFGPLQKVYESKTGNKKYIHYNAKAHPSLSAAGELLISYNQNSFDFQEQLAKNPNLYHPYFLKLKFK